MNKIWVLRSDDLVCFPAFLNANFSFLVSHDYIRDPTNGILITAVKTNGMVEKESRKQRKRGPCLSCLSFIHLTIAGSLLGDWYCVGARKKAHRDLTAG